MIQQIKEDTKNCEKGLSEEQMLDFSSSKQEIQRRLELSNKQVLAYSRDFAHIYRKEKDERQKLEEVHQTLKAIVNSMSDAMVATDKFFKIQEFNLAFADIFPSIRKKENELISNFLPIDIVKKHIVLMKQEERSSISFEFNTAKRNDLVFWITISKLVNSLSNNDGYVFLLHDITEMKRFERLKNQFVLLASQEIQVPLNGLLGLLDLLHKDVKSRLNDEELSYLNFLMNSGKNLQQMIEKLMQISPLQSGDELSKSLVQFDELVMEVLRETDQDIKDQEIQVQFDVRNRGAVLVDRDLVFKALCSIYKVLYTHTKMNGSIKIEMVLLRKNMELHIRCLNISQNDWTDLQKLLDSHKNFKESICSSGVSFALAREIIEWNAGKIKMKNKSCFQMDIVFPSWIQAFDV